MSFAAGFIDDDIIFCKILFHPKTDEKISGVHCRKHFVVRCLAYKKNLCKQQPANDCNQHDPPEKTDVAFLYFCRISSFPDCLRTGMIFFSTHHPRTSSPELSAFSFPASCPVFLLSASFLYLRITALQLLWWSARSAS